jgi:predicted negative regulator of RcsB-dependent stress response
MATNLNLEEQDQLDALKHFWSRFGGAISTVLLLVVLLLAGWNGYRYWQARQASQASAMFDEVERAAGASDLVLAQRAFDDMKQRYASTSYAPQAGLLVAKLAIDGGKDDAAATASAALQWVADNASDEGYRAVAALRLSALMLEAKQYEQAQKTLESVRAEAFVGLAQDRLGDLYAVQNKQAEAKAAYLKAFSAMDAASEYRRLIKIKLNALGVEPPAPAGAG